MAIENQIKSLQNLIADGVITPESVKEQMFSLKEHAVLQVHTKKITLKKNGRYSTNLCVKGSHQKSASTYENLILKLYDYYFDIISVTLESFYPEWMQYRINETSVTDKTVKENNFIWKSLLADELIVKKPIASLKPLDFVIFFRKITKGRQLTKKRFNDMKSILNNMFYYAIEKEIVLHNPLLDINYRQFSFKVANTNIIPYSEDERRMLLDYISDDDLYDLAIKLFFHFTIRIGELKGLRFDDVIGNWLYVQRFVNDKHEVVDDIKGHASAGKRLLPIPSDAKRLLERIKEINSDSDYLFATDLEKHLFITTSTFNKRLRRYCNALGIAYRSSHKLRFSTASILHKNGVGVPELQKMLGHTTSAMTEHYLRDVSARDETYDKVTSIL